MTSNMRQNELDLTTSSQNPVEKAQAPAGVTRRDFFEITAQTSAAFIVGCLFGGKIEAFASDAVTRDLPWNAWVRIAPDNKVTIVVSQAEMGQGIMSTLPAVLAEELGADWNHVQLEMSPANPAYRNPRINFQFTGNSESTMSFFELMRQVGASAREMFIAPPPHNRQL